MSYHIKYSAVEAASDKYSAKQGASTVRYLDGDVDAGRVVLGVEYVTGRRSGNLLIDCGAA